MNSATFEIKTIIQFLMSNSWLEDIVGDQLLINIFWCYPLYRGR